METFAPQEIGVAPPSGGFKTGGWYQGRQYWNGSLSQPGVIHPASNQQGAGQAVSREVNAAGAIAQGVDPQQQEAFLQKERQRTAGAQPQAPAQGQAPTATGPAQQQQGTGVSGGVGQFQQPELDLVGLQKTLFASSGISELETQFSNQEKSFIEAKGAINDNPFLSEATRVGREAKLTKLFDERTANIRGDIATKKADIETQLNLESRQFDINSQQAKQSLDQFNSLLSIGALSNASGEDIANLTRSTGISSTMIRSAIQSSQKKDIKTSTTSFDDGTNQGFVVFNSETGEIINRQNVAASKPLSGPKDPTIGSTQYVAESKSALNQFASQKSNSYGHLSPTDWAAALNAFLADALGTKEDFIKAYADRTDPNRGDFSQAYGFSKDKREKLTE